MNKFKDKRKRAIYEAYVKKYNSGTYLFHKGEQYRGSSDRIAFWNGYNGLKAAYATYESPDNIAYPVYRAGQDCAKGKS